MTKALFINGSPRKSGNTSQLLKRAMDSAAQQLGVFGPTEILYSYDTYQFSNYDCYESDADRELSAAKGGIHALTHALAVSLAGKVRVNSISPGWIDTAYTVYEGPDAIQQPVGRVGNP